MTTATELLNLYSCELALKDAIVEDLAGAQRRKKQLLYLSAWLHQPYLSTNLDQLYNILHFDR